MAKKLLSLTLGLFISTAVLISMMSLMPGIVKGQTHNVNPGESIQTAIDGAAGGDTVFVYSGTYNENLTITKAITLIGESETATIIDGSGLPMGIQISQAFPVNIMNLTIKNFDTGIIISESINVKVREVTIIDCGESGVEADNANNLQIVNCNLTGSGTGTGIDTLQVGELFVENNTIKSFFMGMSLRFSDDPYIYGNNVISNLNSGILIEDSSEGTIGNNYIANHNNNGLKISLTNNILIQDNTIYNTTDKGISISRSEITVESTSIDFSDYGVYSTDISKSGIYNSSISNSQIADVFVGLDSLTLVNTSFNHSKVIIAQNGAFLEVKNYLEVVVKGTKGNIIEGADIVIEDDGDTIYDSTSGDKKTDSNGSTGLIEVDYSYYIYDSSANFSQITSNIAIDVFHDSFEIPIFGSDPDNIDMSNSHKELFLVDNTPPQLSDVSGRGNVSDKLNTLDRNDDDSLAITFSSSEPGQYVMIFDTDFDNKFNESNDSVFSGNLSSGFQTIYWEGTNETGIFTDGIYPLKIILIDVFENEILEPYTAMTVRIVNTDSDGDGYLDINDDLPLEPTQWVDNDRDGFGENPLGLEADLFPQDSTQWFDSDNDGYGDNQEGNDPDLYPFDYTQWIDSDGDGYGDNVSGNNSDAFPEDPTQWLDSDEDGWGDNQSGDNPDAFPDNLYEWKDSDGDGFGDNSADAFPDDPNEWKDADFDGMGDNSDFLPSINNFLFFFIIGITVVVIIAGLYVFRGQKRSERPFEAGGFAQPQVAAAPPVAEPVKSRPPPPRRALKPKPKKAVKPPPRKKKAPAKEAPPPPPPPPEDTEETPPPPDDADEPEETLPPPPDEEQAVKEE